MVYSLQFDFDLVHGSKLMHMIYIISQVSFNCIHFKQVWFNCIHFIPQIAHYFHFQLHFMICLVENFNHQKSPFSLILLSYPQADSLFQK